MGSIKDFRKTLFKYSLKKVKQDKLPPVVYKRNIRGTTYCSPSDFLMSYSKPLNPELNKPELNNNKKVRCSILGY